MKIFIDPGHNPQGYDTGASGYGLHEENVVFEIAQILKDLLITAGHEVKMSRNTITEVIGPGSQATSLNARTELANNWKADLFVSIHCNAFNTRAHGTETLVYALNSDSAKVATRVQNAIVKKLNTLNRGIKERPDLAVLRKTTMPAILVETAFIDHVTDHLLLKDKKQEFAEAIFEGITGQQAFQELTEINDIVWEYGNRGLVGDTKGMKQEMEANPNGRLYWLARKTLTYMRKNKI